VLDDLVVRDGSTLGIHLSETTLVDQFLDGLEVGISVSNVRFNQSEHIDGGFVKFDKDSVVDLS